MFDDTVLMTLIGAALTAIGLFLKYNYLSKCFSIRCYWGCIDARRDTEHEQIIETDGDAPVAARRAM